MKNIFWFNLVWFIIGCILCSLMWFALFSPGLIITDHASMFCYNQGFISYTIDETGNVFCSTKGIEK
jgi:hypothetical protein